MSDRQITRRRLISTAGAVGAGSIVGASLELSGLLDGLVGSAPAAAAATCAVLTPTLTEGPYWVDEKLHRSDVRANSASATSDPGVAQQGVPLTLTINVFDATASCAPLNGAWVDIWHANADGLYSDEAMNMAGGGTANASTAGQDFLRGYQVTGQDSGASGQLVNGQVSFQTIWPGWYTSRAVHIHVRVRTFSSDGATVYNYTTQIFFPDSANDAVFAGAPPYDARSPVDDPTTNENDTVLSSADDATNVVTPSGSVGAGFAAAFNIVIDSIGGSTTTTTPTTTKKIATLRSAKVAASRGGARTLSVTLTLSEAAIIYEALLRGKHKLASRTAKLARGRRTFHLTVPRTVSAGAATLELIFFTSAGPVQGLTHTVHVERRR